MYMYGFFPDSTDMSRISDTFDCMQYKLVILNFFVNNGWKRKRKLGQLPNSTVSFAKKYITEVKNGVYFSAR